MVLKDYLSVSGQHGLFRFIAQGRNAVIVEHLETGKRTTAFASSKVSALEEISVFTTGGETALSVVFDKICEKENGGPAPDDKSDTLLLRDYFSDILPDYDRQRVYPSDIKKIFLWYNTLQKLNLLVKEAPEKEEAEAMPKEENKKEAEKHEDVTKPAGKSAAKSPSEGSSKTTRSKKAPAAGKTGKAGKK